MSIPEDDYRRWVVSSLPKFIVYVLPFTSSNPRWQLRSSCMIDARICIDPRKRQMYRLIMRQSQTSLCSRILLLYEVYPHFRQTRYVGLGHTSTSKPIGPNGVSRAVVSHLQEYHDPLSVFKERPHMRRIPCSRSQSAAMHSCCELNGCTKWQHRQRLEEHVALLSLRAAELH